MYNVYEQRIKDGKIRQMITCLGENKEIAEKQFRPVSYTHLTLPTIA